MHQSTAGLLKVLDVEGGSMVLIPPENDGSSPKQILQDHPNADEAYV
jgi:hypothetical protein